MVAEHFVEKFNFFWKKKMSNKSDYVSMSNDKQCWNIVAESLRFSILDKPLSS